MAWASNNSGPSFSINGRRYLAGSLSLIARFVLPPMNARFAMSSVSATRSCWCFPTINKRISGRLSERGDDPETGRLAIGSPLGKAILGAEEGDEVELLLENGRHRKVLIESVEKRPEPVAVPLGAAGAAVA